VTSSIGLVPVILRASGWLAGDRAALAHLDHPVPLHRFLLSQPGAR
jgi:hypothetical protein